MRGGEREPEEGRELENEVKLCSEGEGGKLDIEEDVGDSEERGDIGKEGDRDGK